MRGKRSAIPNEWRLRSSLELRQLRTFVALVDRGRMTAAARTLGLAQSTVSEAIAALERAIGARVIVRDRGSHQVRLTHAGEVLVPHAREVLAAAAKAHVAVAGATNRAQAAVEIIANESVSSYLLPAALAALREQWPNTRFAVTVATCGDVREGVGAGAFDLGLLLETPDERRRPTRASTGARLDACQIVVPDVQLVVFARPRHPLVAGMPHERVSRTALAGYPLFVSDAAGDFHALVHRFFASDAAGKPQIEAAGSIEGVKESVMADRRATGLLPAYAVADELRTGTLVRMDLRPLPPRMRLTGLLSSSRARHPATSQLVTVLRRLRV